MRQDVYGPLDYGHMLKGRRVLLEGLDPEIFRSVSTLFAQHGAFLLPEAEQDRAAEADVVVCSPVPCGTGQVSGYVSTGLKTVETLFTAALPHMRAQDEGTFVVIGSPYTSHTVPGREKETTLAQALIGYVRAVGMENAKFHIRANYVSTPFPEALSGQPYMQLLEGPGTADDVANAALFLASSFSEFVSGQVLSVNGGTFLIGHNQVWKS